MKKHISWIFLNPLMDNLTSEQREKNMKNIRSKDTLPERIIMDELNSRNISYIKHDSNLVGKPDIVFNREKVIVFIDSDFWHKHPDRFTMPKTNQEYWINKIEKNVERDNKVTKDLIDAGWNVIRLWEFDIKHDKAVCLNKIFIAINRKDFIITD